MFNGAELFLEVDVERSRGHVFLQDKECSVKAPLMGCSNAFGPSRTKVAS